MTDLAVSTNFQVKDIEADDQRMEVVFQKVHTLVGWQTPFSVT